jgi:2-oxoglutarate ferredoxin oxidoreductase subunit delta
MKGTIEIDQERCKGCLFCVEFCPKKAISPSRTLNKKGYFVVELNGDNGCTGCAVCAVVCPEVAIEVYKA